MAAAADRLDVSRALIYIWRSLVRDGLMPSVTMTEQGVSAFSPVAVVPEARPPAMLAVDAPAIEAPQAARGRSGPGSCRASAGQADHRRGGTIEVHLVNGRVLRADEAIDPSALARFVSALDGASE